MTENGDPSSFESITLLQGEFAAALKAGSVVSIREFIASHPLKKLNPEDLVKLICVEMEYRRSLGELISLADFYPDFPQIAELEKDQTITRVLDETTALLTEVFEAEPVATKRRLINPGDHIDDFELLTELGQGSFATVFLARQTSMQRLVALKVSADPSMEAQTLAQLDHPNIVRIFDQRRAVDFDLQLLYMQYLEGGTLLDAAQWIFNRRGELQASGKSLVRAIDVAIIDRGASPDYESPLRKQLMDDDWDRVVNRIGHALAGALDYAHHRGVLHRDIKPANVLIGADCSMKLADFNISAASSVVGAGKFGGSLAYMSPEQIRAFNPGDKFSPDQLTESCDIYSLGVMLIQLLTGCLPFPGNAMSRNSSGLKAMIQERTADGTLREITERLSSHSPLLQNALMKCIAPSPADRHSSARALARQLKIGLDAEAEKLLYPAPDGWSSRFSQWFYPTCIIVALIGNLLAVAFITTFHLFDTVPADFHGTYITVQRVINGIAFPLAATIFVKLTIGVQRALKARKQGTKISVQDRGHAISRNLASGHLQAAVCGLEWIVAGGLYPVVLTLLGVSLPPSAWLNFIASHTLAGVAITTLTFFAISWFALNSWLPELLQDSYSDHSVSASTSGLNLLRKRIPIYQMLAVSIPLLAVVLLVIFSDLLEQSKFSLTVISIFGLFAVPIVLLGGNAIRAKCERLLQALNT